MVWKLTPVNGPSDESTSYCFISPGTYKVGRKDCEVCIPKDKTISRLHAEFVVHPLPPWKPGVVSSQTKCEVMLKDLSKFGTFVNKASGSKPVFRLPDKQTAVRDGDSITFGTGHSSFIATYLHLFFCISAPRADSIISRTTSELGAYGVRTWNPDCTHVLAEDSSAVTELVLMAVCHHKPVVSLEWLEAVCASSSPAGDVPDISSYIPKLRLELNNSAVEVVEPQRRTSTFKNIIFLAGALEKYHSKENLKLIVSAGGGRLEMISKAKESRGEQILIVPHGANDADVPELFTGSQHVQRIRESDLLLSVLSGCRDDSKLFTVSSIADSQSTDATVDLQDTDDDGESVLATPKPKVSPETVKAPQQSDSNKTQESEEKAEETSKFKEPDTETIANPSFTSKKDEPTNTEQFGEVKCVVGLVIECQPPNKSPVASAGVPNFKNFRRVGVVPGNSFHAFVAFDPQPYGETSYFTDHELEKFMKQEKKRKLEEELADDLFRSDNLKRQKTAKGEKLALLKVSELKRKK